MHNLCLSNMATHPFLAYHHSSTHLFDILIVGTLRAGSEVYIVNNYTKPAVQYVCANTPTRTNKIIVYLMHVKSWPLRRTSLLHSGLSKT